MAFKSSAHRIKQMREWKKNNPEKIREQHRQWRQRHPAEEREYNKQYQREHPEQCQKWQRDRHILYRTTWRTWLLAHGYMPPSPKFHYHHVDTETKKFKIGDFIGHYPCSPKWQLIIKEELDKCILLSTKEHVMLHRALNEGEPV